MPAQAAIPLDLTRGKPVNAQLDLADAMEDLPKNKMILEDGTDLRNEARIIFLIDFLLTPLIFIDP